jgi:predicted SAM-dependent methyltransferase
MRQPLLIRRIARRLAAPATTRAMARVDTKVAAARDEAVLRVHEVNHELSHELAALREHVLTIGHEAHVTGNQVEEIDRHLPALLNAISSQHAAAREQQRSVIELGEAVQRLQSVTPEAMYDHVRRADEIVAEILHARVANLEARVESIRREVLYEVTYRSGATAPARGTPTVDEAALDAVRRERPIRLNVGAGHICLEGFTNVDQRPLDGIGLVADARDLPFDDHEVACIRATHLLEHFPEEELRRVLLPNWLRVLEDAGRLEVVVPDAEAMIAAHVRGDMSFDDLRLVTFGQQEYDGDYHHTMFTASSLGALLKESGFVDVEVIESGRRNGACLEMEIHARASVAST